MIIKNCKIDGEICDIKVLNGVIEDIGTFDDADSIDLGGLEVYAGLIDIHTHGANGYDTMDMGALEELALFEAKHGVTSFLPTTMSVAMKDISDVVHQEINLDNKNCSQILGFHMEGPYISKKYKGAQNEEHIKPLDLDEFRALPNISVVTIAPELDNSSEFIAECESIVSLGHTQADYDCTVKAIKAGAKSLTHTFNAMSGLHHRNSGPIGAAIDEGIYTELICDGLHVCKSAVTMLYRTMGRDKVILISDSMRATGLSDGEYEFGGQLIDVKDKVARTKDGSIAGSTTVLFDCVKKAVEFGIPKEDAFYMASAVPAEFLGVNKGKIAKGYSADIIAVDDDLNLKRVIIGGNEIKI